MTEQLAPPRLAEDSGTTPEGEAPIRQNRRRWRMTLVALVAMISVMGMSMPGASAHVRYMYGSNGCKYYVNHITGNYSPYRASTTAVNDTNTSGSLAKDCRAVQAFLRYKKAGKYYSVYGWKTSGISYAQAPVFGEYVYGMSRSLDYGAPAWGGWKWH